MSMPTPEAMHATPSKWIRVACGTARWLWVDRFVLAYARDLIDTIEHRAGIDSILRATYKEHIVASSDVERALRSLQTAISTIALVVEPEIVTIDGQLWRPAAIEEHLGFLLRLLDAHHANLAKIRIRRAVDDVAY